MTPKTPTVRNIRAILRKAGVPLSEFKAEKKYGPRYRTVGADVYTAGDGCGVFVEWCDGRQNYCKLPDGVRAALSAHGYTTDSHALVRCKDSP